MFSATEAENRKASCGTHAIAERSAESVYACRSTPFQRSAPAAGAWWRSSSRRQRGLARAGRPDEPQRAACGQLHRHAIERGAGLARIAEGHALRHQRAGHHLGNRPVVVHAQWLVQHRLQPAPCRLAALQQRQHPAGREHRPDQLPEVQAEAGELADSQLGMPHQPAADAERQHGGGAQGEAHRRLIRRLPALRIEARAGRRPPPVSKTGPRCGPAARAPAACARPTASPAHGR